MSVVITSCAVGPTRVTQPSRSQSSCQAETYSTPWTWLNACICSSRPAPVTPAAIRSMGEPVGVHHGHWECSLPRGCRPQYDNPPYFQSLQLLDGRPWPFEIVGAVPHRVQQDHIGVGRFQKAKHDIIVGIATGAGPQDGRTARDRKAAEPERGGCRGLLQSGKKRSRSPLDVQPLASF